MQFSLQTEEFKDCPPGFLYILALSMVIKEVQADNELLSTRQYQEGKFTFVVGIFVSFERFTCFEIGTLRNYDGNDVDLGSRVHICFMLQKAAWPSDY